MQFYDYQTLFQMRHHSRDRRLHKLTPAEFYRIGIKSYRQSRGFSGPIKVAHESQTVLQPACEGLWYHGSRPYYNLWPVVAGMLHGVQLNFRAGRLQFPLPAFVVRLAHGQDVPNLPHIQVQSLLVAELQGRLGTEKGGPVMELVVQYYRRDEPHEKRDATMALRLVEDLDLAAVMRDPGPNSYERAIKEGVDIEQLQQILLATTPIAVGVCMLAFDKELTQPEPLAADKQKYAETQDPRYLEKAARRGKVAWNIGEHLVEPEQLHGGVSPHWRNPTLGIRWTGKGRTIPTLTYIKGSFVNKDKLLEVPTGYLDQEQTP